MGWDEHTLKLRPRAYELLFGVLLILQAFTVAYLNAHGVRTWIVLCFVIAPIGLVVLPQALLSTMHSLSGLSTRFGLQHFLWVLLLVSSLVFRSRDSQDIRESPVDASAVFRIALVGGAGALLFLFLGPRQSALLRTLRHGVFLWLSLYVGIALFSTIWSVYPSWTIYKSLEYFIDVCIAANAVVIFSTWRECKSLFDWTWLLFCLMLGTVILGIFLWPEEAVIRNVGSLGIQLQGVVPSISANTVGDLAATLSIVAISRLLFRFRQTHFYLALCGALTLLVLSQTRSAIAGFVVALVVLLCLARRTTLLILIAAGVLIAILATDFGSVARTFLARGQSPELLASFTGRRQWWESGWEQFQQRPLTGFGAYAGGRFVALEAMGAGDVPNVHNTYLEILFGTGLMGLLCFCVAILLSWYKLLKRIAAGFQSSIEKMLCLESIGLLAFLTVRSFFTVDFVWHPALTFFLIAIIASYSSPQLHAAVPATAYVVAAPTGRYEYDDIHI